MKKMMMMSILMLSVSAFAETQNCKNDAIAIAQMNLNQVAAKEDAESAFIDESTMTLLKTSRVKVSKNAYEMQSTYSMNGVVVKGDYVVTVRLSDAECAIRDVSVRIK